MKSVRWAILLLLCALLAAQSAQAELPKKPDNANTYVFDYTQQGVMSAEDVLRMDVAAQALHDDVGPSMVAVMVDFLDGAQIEYYANDLFNAWGIGDKKRNDGALLLFSRGDRQIYLLMGDGLEKAIPASVRGDLLDQYAIPYLKQNDFSEGLRAVFIATCEKIAQVKGKTIASAGVATPQTEYRDYHADTDYDYDTGYGYDYSRDYGDGFDSRNFARAERGWLSSLITLLVIFWIVRAIFRPRATSGGNAGCGCLPWLLLGGMLNGGGRGYTTYGPRSPMPPFGGMGNPFGSGGPFGGGRSGGGGGGFSGGFRGGGGRSSGGGTGRGF